MRAILILLLSGNMALAQSFTFKDLAFMSQQGQASCNQADWVYLIPTMSDFNTPVTGQVSATEEGASGFESWRAFDGITNGCGQSGQGSCQKLNATIPWSITFQFTAANPLARAWSFGIPATGNSQQTISVLGSSNGSTWVTLDSITYTDDVGCNSYYTNKVFANSTRYSYYKFEWSGVVDGNCSFTGIQLYGCP